MKVFSTKFFAIQLLVNQKRIYYDNDEQIEKQKEIKSSL